MAKDFGVVLSPLTPLPSISRGALLRTAPTEPSAMFGRAPSRSAVAGELALLSADKRAATVTATVDT